MLLGFESEFALAPQDRNLRPLHGTALAPAPPPSRAVERRVRRQEEAWALHAAHSNGFGGGETAL
jgi:hypothetical protein